MHKRIARSCRLYAFPVLVVILGFLVPGCASTPDSATDRQGPPVITGFPVQPLAELHEIPVPADGWREHRLTTCPPDTALPYRVERYLGTCSELFRDGSGSDGMIELEMALDAGVRHPLILMTLGQLYLMAGQGDPDLMPEEGPAADVGNWQRNKQRLLGRARQLFDEAQQGRPDDAAIDYLLADVMRAGGDFEAASQLVAKGMAKCTGGRSFRILQQYQDLNHYPPRYLGGAQPIYPPAALEEQLNGDVVLDLLLDPEARIRQFVTVSTPGIPLSESAAEALRRGNFTAARVGKYPVWSWLRVTISFNLDP